MQRTGPPLKRRQNKRVNKKRIKKVVLFAGLVLAAAGCGSQGNIPEETQRTEPVRQESGNNTQVSAFYQTEETAGREEDSEIEPEKEVVYEVLDLSGIVKEENEADRAREDTWDSAAASGMPEDTVVYVPSSREEITETVYEETVVDENDPSTYQVVEREQEVAVTTETPTEYTDSSGKVKYALKDGIWYEYSYSTGGVVLDSEDEEFALMILNIDGSYDGYELVEITCEPIEEEGNAAEYSYQVLYRRPEALEEAPTEVDHLTVSATVQTQSIETRTVQEKLPVTVSREVPTGEYRYFGWQQEEQGICYYDENGERVTGNQVIQGLRYQFDQDGYLISRTGVDVSGRNGAVDWNRVRNAGAEFAVIRGGYRGSQDGVLYLDAEAERNLKNAASAGMETGVYIFSQAVTEREAVEEASLAVSLAREYGTSLPVALKLDFSGTSYRGRADGLSPEDRTKIIRAFCATVRSAEYEPIIFANENWLSNSADLPEDVKVWFAADGADHSDMAGCVIWQYTSAGTVDGITGNAGINISCKEQQ